MEQKHTQGKLEVESIRDIPEYVIVSVFKRTILFWTGFFDRPSEVSIPIREANARRMVKCWNNHDALLTACEEAKGYIATHPSKDFVTGFKLLTKLQRITKPTESEGE